MAACGFLHKHLQNILGIFQDQVCVSSGTLHQAGGIRQSVPVVSELAGEAASPKYDKERCNRYEVPACSRWHFLYQESHHHSDSHSQTRPIQPSFPINMLWVFFKSLNFLRYQSSECQLDAILWWKDCLVPALGTSRRNTPSPTQDSRVSPQPSSPTTLFPKRGRERTILDLEEGNLNWMRSCY